MAWVSVNLDETLLQKDPLSNEYSSPSEGAIEAMNTLVSEGHRLTVITTRFNLLPPSQRNQMKQDLEQALLELGFPPMEVWNGTTKPSVDIHIGHDSVTYDGDWGLVLAQAQQMLEDRGLLPGPMPGAAEEMTNDEAAAEQPQPEEQPDADEEAQVS